MEDNPTSKQVPPLTSDLLSISKRDHINNERLHKSKEGKNFNLITYLDEWEPMIPYAPELISFDMDMPDEVLNQEFFKWFTTNQNTSGMIDNLILAHKSHKIW